MKCFSSCFCIATCPFSTRPSNRYIFFKSRQVKALSGAIKRTYCIPLVDQNRDAGRGLDNSLQMIWQKNLFQKLSRFKTDSRVDRTHRIWVSVFGSSIIWNRSISCSNADSTKWRYSLAHLETTTSGQQSYQQLCFHLSYVDSVLDSSVWLDVVRDWQQAKRSYPKFDGAEWFTRLNSSRLSDGFPSCCNMQEIALISAREVAYPIPLRSQSRAETTCSWAAWLMVSRVTTLSG